MAWSRLRRAREKVEGYIEREVKEPVREVNEGRYRSARDSAKREYQETVHRAAQDEQQGRISHELASKRVIRARKRYKTVSTPVGTRALNRATLGAGRMKSDVVRGYRTGKIGRGYANVTKSYHKAWKSERGMRSTRSTQQFGSVLLTGSPSKKVKPAWGLILYGSKAGKGSGSTRKSGRKGKRSSAGNSSQDPFWML